MINRVRCLAIISFSFVPAVHTQILGFNAYGGFGRYCLEDVVVVAVRAVFVLFFIVAAKIVSIACFDSSSNTPTSCFYGKSFCTFCRQTPSRPFCEEHDRTPPHDIPSNQTIVGSIELGSQPFFFRLISASMPNQI